MELVFEILSIRPSMPQAARRKVFDKAGGVIGRQRDCDWVIPDPANRLSKHHAVVSYRDGLFWLTDTSSNGIWNSANGERLCKGMAVSVEHGATYDMSGTVIRAQVRRADALAAFGMEGGWKPVAQETDLELDPLEVLKQQEQACAQIDALLAPAKAAEDSEPCADYARIDMENLQVPELVEAPPESVPEPECLPPERQTEGFWEQYAAALGVDLAGLDTDAREALALSAARLLRQSIDGLQQSLRTRSDLKNELRLAQTSLQGLHKTPLQSAADPGEALSVLLKPDRPGQLPPERVVARAFRDLQAHQVAMLTASRAAMRGTLEHFSPQQMALRLEREGKPLFVTAGNRWRAYGRYHQSLCQDDDWTERLLARDFSQAYEEQVRLIATFYTGQQG